MKYVLAGYGVGSGYNCTKQRPVNFQDQKLLCAFHAYLVMVFCPVYLILAGFTPLAAPDGTHSLDTPRWVMARQGSIYPYLCRSSNVLLLYTPLTSVTFQRNSGSKTFIRSIHRLLVTADVVPSSPILFTLMMKAIRSSQTSVLTRATLCNTPEDGILHIHSRDILKSYVILYN
jgi:hypothetical protein